LLKAQIEADNSDITRRVKAEREISSSDFEHCTKLDCTIIFRELVAQLRTG
jgi:hypothetical protein